MRSMVVVLLGVVAIAAGSPSWGDVGVAAVAGARGHAGGWGGNNAVWGGWAGQNGGQWRDDTHQLSNGGWNRWNSPGDDGQWNGVQSGVWAGRGAIGHGRWRRSLVGLINPNSLPVPADDIHVAIAKQAQLIQQHTEGVRNIHGGIPINLPADTHEVAIGKQAHAIAHARQNAITHGAHLGIGNIGLVSPVVHGVGIHGVHGSNGLWW